ncbi:hypothetical protein PQ459_04845 [Chryseobacterium sp. KACC 21268]|nr:hypothetical protein PQ459_04845 [Chryseobacterium sp. KACC 21268]
MNDNKLQQKINIAMFRKNISSIHSLKDIYKNLSGEYDLKNIDIDILLETKKVFEWILEHPEYNYTQFSDYEYSNEILYNYFKIYYQDILYRLDKYFKEDYIIKYSDFNNE